MRSLAVLFLFAAPVALAAPVPKEVKKTDSLVGMWALTSSSLGGRAPTPREGLSWKLDADGKASIIQQGGITRGEIKYAVDPSARTFDWLPPWGEFYGVYELKDDVLTVYLKRTKDKAARNLEPKGGPDVDVHAYRRVPEKK